MRAPAPGRPLNGLHHNMSGLRFSVHGLKNPPSVARRTMTSPMTIFTATLPKSSFFGRSDLRLLLGG
jgi:hypothetical protein